MAARTQARNAQQTVRPTPANVPPRRATPAAKTEPAAGPRNVSHAVSGAVDSPFDMEVLEVDKELAEAWLEKNISNRPIRKRKVNEYKRDMLDDNWHDLGDPIRFDEEGNLCDGQHRMLALVAADEEDPGQVFPFVVMHNIPIKAKVAIDIGSKRSAGDQLRIAGYTNHTLLASASKWILIHERGQIYSENAVKSVTHPEILEYVEEHPLLQEAAKLMMNRYVKKISVPVTYLCVTYYLCASVDRKATDFFFDRVGDGVNLGEGDPILALRTRLFNIMRTNPHMTGDMWLSLLFRAWNAYRSGKKVSSLPLYKGSVTSKGEREPVRVPDLMM